MQVGFLLFYCCILFNLTTDIIHKLLQNVMDKQYKKDILNYTFPFCRYSNKAQVLQANTTTRKGQKLVRIKAIKVHL